MSAYRDALSARQLDRFDRAQDEAAPVLAAARAERDRLAMTGGPEAVALAADEVAEKYRKLQGRARRKAAA